jgi:hypothetical protein
MVSNNRKYWGSRLFILGKRNYKYRAGRYGY